MFALEPFRKKTTYALLRRDFDKIYRNSVISVFFVILVLFQEFSSELLKNSFCKGRSSVKISPKTRKNAQQ